MKHQHKIILSLLLVSLLFAIQANGAIQFGAMRHMYIPTYPQCVRIADMNGDVHLYPESIHTYSEYRTLVQKFCMAMKNVQPVNMKTCYSFFGDGEWTEVEYTLFKERCLKLKSIVDCYKEFESQSDSVQSLYFEALRRKLSNYFKNMNDSQIATMCNNLKFYDEGDEEYLVVSLKTSSGKILYFDLSKKIQQAVTIQEIYLPSGEVVLDEYNQGKYYLELLAIINSRDNFVNVHKMKSDNSEILFKIHSNELFLYQPATVNEWCVVRRMDDQAIGYIHSNQLIPLANCSKQRIHSLRRQLYAPPSYDVFKKQK